MPRPSQDPDSPAYADDAITRDDMDEREWGDACVCGHPQSFHTQRGCRGCMCPSYRRGQRRSVGLNGGDSGLRRFARKVTPREEG